VVGGVAAASLAYFALVVGAAFRSRRRAVAIGDPVGAAAPVLSWAGDAGFVQLEGESWRARSSRPLRAGQTARVVRRDGLTVWVEGEE
jgi:membrane-bound serine protease (ClpP class)